MIAWAKPRVSLMVCTISKWETRIPGCYL